jgi:hypothetical protein
MKIKGIITSVDFEPQFANGVVIPLGSIIKGFYIKTTDPIDKIEFEKLYEPMKVLNITITKQNDRTTTIPVKKKG